MPNSTMTVTAVPKVVTPKLLPSPPGVPFVFSASIDRVIDGDTVHARIDLGFNTWHDDKFRFAHINAPEMKTPEGPVTKEFVTAWIAAQKSFTFFSKGQDKYGRWIAVIWGDDQSISINQILLDKGLAVPYM